MKLGAVAGMSLVLVLLAGCGGAVEPSATPTAAAMATPSPAPTYGPPEVVFGGECDRVVTSADVEAAYGAAPVNGVEQGDPMGYPELTAMGGLACSWSLPDGSGTTVRITPAARVAPAPDAPLTCYRDFSSTCEFEAIESGYWINGMSGVLDESYAAAVEAGAQALVELIAPRAAAQGAPAVAPTYPGTWSAEDCAALSADAAVPAVFGEQGLQVDVDVTDVYYVQQRLRTFTAATACTWESSEDPWPSFGVELIPGAGWMAAAAAAQAGAVPVTLTGATEAAWVPTVAEFPDYVQLFATDGVNLVLLSPHNSAMSHDSLGAVVSAVIAAAS